MSINEQEIKNQLNVQIEQYNAKDRSVDKRSATNIFLEKVPLVFNKDKANLLSLPYEDAAYRCGLEIANYLLDSSNTEFAHTRLANYAMESALTIANALAASLVTRDICTNSRKAFGNYTVAQETEFRYLKPDGVSILDTITNVLETTKSQGFDYLTFSSRIFRYLSNELSGKLKENETSDSGFVRQYLANTFNCVVEIYDGTIWKSGVDDKLTRIRLLSRDTILFSNSKTYENPDIWKVDCSIPEIEIKDNTIWVKFYADAIQYQDGLTAVLYVNADE